MLLRDLWAQGTTLSLSGGQCLMHSAHCPKCGEHLCQVIIKSMKGLKFYRAETKYCNATFELMARPWPWAKVNHSWWSFVPSYLKNSPGVEVLQSVHEFEIDGYTDRRTDGQTCTGKTGICSPWNTTKSELLFTFLPNARFIWLLSPWSLYFRCCVTCTLLNLPNTSKHRNNHLLLLPFAKAKSLVFVSCTKFLAEDIERYSDCNTYVHMVFIWNACW